MLMQPYSLVTSAGHRYSSSPTYSTQLSSRSLGRHSIHATRSLESNGADWRLTKNLTKTKALCHRQENGIWPLGVTIASERTDTRL